MSQAIDRGILVQNGSKRQGEQSQANAKPSRPGRCAHRSQNEKENQALIGLCFCAHADKERFGVATALRRILDITRNAGSCG
jgi:hypothetical protein